MRRRLPAGVAHVPRRFNYAELIAGDGVGAAPAPAQRCAPGIFDAIAPEPARRWLR